MLYGVVYDTRRTNLHQLVTKFAPDCVDETFVLLILESYGSGEYWDTMGLMDNNAGQLIVSVCNDKNDVGVCRF